MVYVCIFACVRNGQRTFSEQPIVLAARAIRQPWLAFNTVSTRAEGPTAQNLAKWLVDSRGGVLRAFPVKLKGLFFKEKAFVVL